jgi:GNAT superfamily N-acetyltransferase
VIRTAWPHDLPALQALFAEANDAPYDLAAAAEEKCFGTGVAGVPVTRVFEERGHIVGASVACGRWLRVLVVGRAARRKKIGSALLADAESRGAAVIAAEPGNYFTPGVVDSDAGSCSFFRARGYIETRWTHNLHVGLPVTAAVSSTVRRPAHAESDRVLDFIEAEFGRIWRFEAGRAFDRDVPVLFIAEHEGKIAGFAAHDVNNRGLGFFGPTGVAKALRGRGVGCQLLLASLADMERLGFDRAVIPWTDALEFYRKCCGAEPAHRFIAFAKPQP